MEELCRVATTQRLAGVCVTAVRRLQTAVPEAGDVKASGGIHSHERALAMLEAGADRIGASAETALLGRDENVPTDAY